MHPCPRHSIIITSQKFLYEENKLEHECNKCRRQPLHTWNPHPKWVKGEKDTHHHRNKKNPTQEGNLHDSPEPTEDPHHPQKESAQPPELRIFKQTRTTPRWMAPLVRPASYSQAQLPLVQTQSKRWASYGSFSRKPSHLQVPLTTPPAHLYTGTRRQYG